MSKRTVNGYSSISRRRKSVTYVSKRSVNHLSGLYTVKWLLKRSTGRGITMKRLILIALGIIYANSEAVSQAPADMRGWYHTIGEQRDANTQAMIDDMLKQGMSQDNTENVKWVRKAANEGDASAQFMLGVMYTSGEGVSQDYAEAVKWIRKAAKKGVALAQFKLADMYIKGEGVPQDFTEAFNWTRKAAKKGEVNAQFNLAHMYAHGEGVAQDNADAVKWYRKAAEQGDTPAQYVLGVMYGNGEGVSQDNPEAYVWYSLAAASGFEEAIKSRDLIKQELSPADLDAAQKRVAKLSEKIQQSN